MRPIRVLHVDDRPAFVDAFADSLEKGHEAVSVVAKSSASDAFDHLAASESTVDCVVSEYDVPGTSGLEFVETVRERRPGLPSILVTDRGNEAVATEAFSAGVTEYFRKADWSDRLDRLADRVVDTAREYQSMRRRERLADAIETAVLGVCLVDDRGTIRYHNRSMAELYGAESTELVGSSWERLYSDRDVGEFGEEIVLTLAERGTWSGRGDRIGPSGDRVLHELTVSALESGWYLCFVRDATDVVEPDQELRRTQRRYRAIFEDPNILVGLLDSDGHLVRANQTALEYVEADSVAHVAGDPFWETPWWDDRIRDEIRECVERAAGGEYVEYEADLEGPDGEPFSVEGVIRPVTDDADETESMVVSARDVTERKQRERRLERQNERFDDLATVVSHDLQTPLSTARGHLELALDDGDLERVEPAIDALDRVDEMRRDVVNVLRNREIAVDPERIAIEDAVEIACTAIGGIEPRDVEIDPVELTADPDGLVRLFENLLSNSVEHGEGTPAVHVGPCGDGFYYEDDGPGIDPAIRADVFTPGFSTKPGSGGGMGMTSVRQIADAHGWRIDTTEASILDGVRFEIRS